jgi:hypothetical protein
MENLEYTEEVENFWEDGLVWVLVLVAGEQSHFYAEFG